MVSDAGDYRWSSYGCNALGQTNPIVKAHDLYTGLGIDEDERRIAYRALFETTIPKEDLDTIRTATRFSMPVDSKLR